MEKLFGSHFFGMTAAVGSPIWRMCRAYYAAHLLGGVFSIEDTLILWPRAKVLSVDGFLKQLHDDFYRARGFTAVMYSHCWACMRSSPPITRHSAITWLQQTISLLFKGEPYCGTCHTEMDNGELTQALYMLRSLQEWQHAENVRVTLETGYHGQRTHCRRLGEIFYAAHVVAAKPDSSEVRRYQWGARFFGQCLGILASADLHVDLLLNPGMDYHRPARQPNQIPASAFEALSPPPGSPPIHQWDPLKVHEWPHYAAA